jgi:hypothetical protein
MEQQAEKRTLLFFVHGIAHFLQTATFETFHISHQEEYTLIIKLGKDLKSQDILTQWFLVQA